MEIINCLAADRYTEREVAAMLGKSLSYPAQCRARDPDLEKGVDYDKIGNNILWFKSGVEKLMRNHGRPKNETPKTAAAPKKPKRAGIAMTEFDEECVKFGYKNGLSDKVIADFLMRSENAVRQIRSELGLTNTITVWTDEMNTALLLLCDQLGKTLKEAADILNVSYHSAASQLYKLHGGRNGKE